MIVFYNMLVCWCCLHSLLHNTFNGSGVCCYVCYRKTNKMGKLCECACKMCVCPIPHTCPLYLITLLNDIIKITSLISPMMTFPWGQNSSSYILLLSLSLSSLALSSPHFFLSSSLSPPTPTQDNHPKAKFSIKSVTLFHSHRAIHDITHTNHLNTK